MPLNHLHNDAEDFLWQESSQLKEYNSHLEHQFMTQSRIVEAMKRKLAEQKVFADLIHKLAEINEAEVIQEHLENYIDSAESETKILAENFSRIIQNASQLCTVSPELFKLW
ncbi:hypothetical protein COOONC_00251 [Cooperia oncophora]